MATFWQKLKDLGDYYGSKPSTDLYGVPIDSYVRGSQYDPGSSAVHEIAVDKAQTYLDDINSGRKRPLLDTSISRLSDFVDGGVITPSSANTYYSAPVPSVSSIQYFDAPYAEKYGMSAETAYSEALAGSAHQREMADLRAAGLNPVLTATRGSGADVVSASQNISYSEPRSGSGTAAKGILKEIFPTLVGGVTGLMTGSSSKGNSAKALADVAMPILPAITGR